MKQGQFTDEQIVAILQEAEKGEKTVGALCKEHTVSENTFYRWRNKFGGMQVKETQRLRELEKENAHEHSFAVSGLKRLLAERDLEIDIVKEYLAKN